MQFGVCAQPEDADRVKTAGADFIETWVQPVLKPQEATWTPPVDPQALPLPIPGYNSFFPGELKITGPEADLERITAHARRAFERARALGSEFIVFGSGKARMIPEGFPRQEAEAQFVACLEAIAPLGAAQGVRVILEPLNRGESNILNTVTEGLGYIERANAANLAVLVDWFHMARDNVPMADLDGCAAHLKHVHVAEPEGRISPRPGMTNVRSFLAKLKALGYDRRISIECQWEDLDAELGPSLAYLRQEWAAA